MNQLFTSGGESMDYKESWAPKNGCFGTEMLEKTLESPLDSEEIQPVHPKEISPEYSLEGLMLNLKLQYFGYLNWFIWEDPDAGKIWRQEEKGTIEDEMVGWHYQLNGHEFEKTLEVGDGQGGLMLGCSSWGCSPWGHKGLDLLSNWTELTTICSCTKGHLSCFHVLAVIN